MKLILPVAMAFLLLSATCNGEDQPSVPEAVKRLQVAMEKEAKADTGEENGQMDEMRSAVLMQLSMMSSDQDSIRNFTQLLSQTSQMFRSEEVRSEITQVLAAIKAENIKTEKAQIDQLQEILDQARSVVKKASTPADLDAMIQALQENRGRNNSYQTTNPDLRLLSTQIEQSAQFLIQWQNYLAAKADNNSKKAKETLQTLSNSNFYGLMPRSEILALLAAPEKPDVAIKAPEKQSSADEVEMVLSATNDLESIATAIKKLRELRDPKRYDDNGVVNSTIQALSPIDKTYQDFKAGLATNIESYQNYSNAEIGTAKIAELKRKLLLLVLPRYVGVSDGFEAKPDETVNDFLNRLATEAKERGDTSVGLRIKEVSRLLSRGSAFSNSDQTGLHALISGQNQEAAGQFMLAVVSYQNALKSGSDLVPAKLIGERLAAIQKSHPEDYQAGMDRFLSPPVTRPDFPGHFPPQPGQRPEPNPPPALLIPPAPTSKSSP